MNIKVYSELLGIIHVFAGKIAISVHVKSMFCNISFYESSNKIRYIVT